MNSCPGIAQPILPAFGTVQAQRKPEENERRRTGSRAPPHLLRGVMSEASEKSACLVLEGVVTGLAGTDLDGIFHGGEEDLAVAQVAGV